jgi:DNA-binding MarR family transcriptional regulator
VPLPWMLRRVNQRYRTAAQARLTESGLGDLPQPGYWALTVLSRGDTEAGRLMEEMGVSKQAVSKLVDILVAAGFVERRANDEDRRRTDLLLTAKGRKAVGVIKEAARSIEDSFVAELGAKRFADLVRMLSQLARWEG